MSPSADGIGGRSGRGTADAAPVFRLSFLVPAPTRRTGHAASGRSPRGAGLPRRPDGVPTVAGGGTNKSDALAGRAGLRDGQPRGPVPMLLGVRAISSTSRRAITRRPEGKPDRTGPDWLEVALRPARDRASPGRRDGAPARPPGEGYRARWSSSCGEMGRVGEITWVPNLGRSQNSSFVCVPRLRLLRAARQLIPRSRTSSSM